MDWFDSTLNVRLVHPAGIQAGMRLARHVEKPIGPHGEMKPATELTPVWDIGIGASGGYHGMRYLFRLMTGELRTATSSDRMWADPEILPENRPPHETTWITNEPFGFHDHLGFTTDREWYERSRLVSQHTTEDGRVYRLLAGKHGVLKVCRWDQGKKWLGPARITPEGAYDQFDAIVQGTGW
jgi:hypothetical protein